MTGFNSPRIGKFVESETIGNFRDVFLVFHQQAFDFEHDATVYHTEGGETEVLAAQEAGEIEQLFSDIPLNQ